VNLGSVQAVTYAFPGARVTVAFEVSGFADWLDEVLRPPFAPRAPDPGAVTVVVRDGAQTAGPTVGARRVGPVPCFVFEHELVRHDAWQVGDHIEVFDDKYGTRYVLGPHAIGVEVVGPFPGTRAGLLRVVRELAIGQALADEHRLLLHASAIEHEGKVVLFSGSKGAGKTTLAARLASVDGSAFVANDCTLVSAPDAAPSGWSAHGVPVPVSVRADTVQRLPHLFRAVPATARPSRLTLAEADAAATRHGTVRDPVRLQLSPPQFARALGCSMAASGSVACLAFVTVSDDVRGFDVSDIDETASRARIATSVYGPRGSETGCTVFEEFLGVHRPESADTRTGGRFAAEVRCVELQVAPGILEDDGLARGLLALLLERT
jgi:hypothetical protein